MSDDPSRARPHPSREDVAAADDRAAAAEAAEVERNDMNVADEAALNEVTLPPTAPVAPPAALPPDGI